jgi:hypothetical protein
MTKNLRKKHLQFWTVLAVLLPVGIISGWLVIPDQQHVKLLQQSSPALLSAVYRSIDKPSYAINLRTDETKKQWQLEFKNKQVLTVPSAVVYQVDTADTTKRKLVGRIEAKGDYVFALQQDSAGRVPTHFILYDFIHEETLDTINLK